MFKNVHSTSCEFLGGQVLTDNGLSRRREDGLIKMIKLQYMVLYEHDGRHGSRFIHGAE